MLISPFTQNVRKPHHTYNEGRNGISKRGCTRNTETLRAPEMKKVWDCPLLVCCVGCWGTMVPPSLKDNYKTGREKGRKGIPARGNSVGKGLEVREGLGVVGKMQNPEGEWRGEDQTDMPDKAARTVDPAEANNLR